MPVTLVQLSSSTVTYRHIQSVNLTTPELEKSVFLSQFCGSISVYETKNEAWEQMGTLVLLIACFV